MQINSASAVKTNSQSATLDPQESRQSSNIVTATFGGEQKFFPNGQPEPKLLETQMSNGTSASVKDAVNIYETPAARVTDFMHQRNKSKLSNNMSGSIQAKLKQPNKSIQHIDGQRLLVGKAQAIILK